MRPPVVKRPTFPRSGGCSFVPRWWSRRRRPLATCSGGISPCRCRPNVSAPHPSGGAVTIERVRAERRWDRPLRPRNVAVPAYRPPQRRGCTEVVRQFGPGSGEGQPTAPERASRRIARRRSGCPINGQRIWAKGPLCSCAFTDAALHAGPSTTLRLRPWSSRSACGSSAPPHAPERNLRRANAVWRLNLSETARPSVWASMVQALPFPGLCASVVRSCGPAGWWRRHNPAASEPAHLRSA